MKRFFALLLALLHLAATTGASVYVHHCMGREVSTSFQDSGEEDIHFCSHCGMQKKKEGNGCCRDEVRVVKTSTDGTVSAGVSVLPVQDAVLPRLPQVAAYPRTILSGLAPALVHGTDQHGPPGTALPLWLAVRSLRI